MSSCSIIYKKLHFQKKKKIPASYVKYHNPCRMGFYQGFLLLILLLLINPLFRLRYNAMTL